MDFGLPEDIALYVLSQYAKQAYLFVLISSKMINYIGKDKVCEIAARIGHLELLKLGIERSFPLEAITYYNAAFGGHLDTLIWLQSQNDRIEKQYNRSKFYYWNSKLCTYAANKGHLHVIQWLLTHDSLSIDGPCSWNIWIHMQAIIHDHPKIIDWMNLKHGKLANSLILNMARIAAKHKSWKILQWIKMHYPEQLQNGNLLQYAIQHKYIEIVRWLRSIDPPCPYKNEYLKEYVCENRWLGFRE